LQPEPLNGLARFDRLGDVIEDQFAFAARVAGVDQAADILALDQLAEQLEARRGLLDRREREVRRDDRQVGEGPFAAFDLEFLGTGQLEQVTDRRREHEVFAFEVVVVLGETPQRLGDVGGDGGFFGNDQLLGHGFNQ
jgi:hypothetical protein